MSSPTKNKQKQKRKHKPSSTAFGGVNVAMEPAGEVLDLGPQELVILHEVLHLPLQGNA